MATQSRMVNGWILNPTNNKTPRGAVIFKATKRTGKRIESIWGTYTQVKSEIERSNGTRKGNRSET